MYLDRLTITSEELKRFPETVSADVCGNDVGAYRSLLPYVDYLFVSGLKPGLAARFPVRRGVVTHAPGRITYTTKSGDTREHRFIPEAGLNVLGAGDYLAANCIAGLVAGDLDLELAHFQTLEMLRRQS